MKKEFLMPIFVLSLICLVVSGALAVGNTITQPVIEEAAAARAEIIKREIIPDADDLVLLEAEGLPQSITRAYVTSNHIGYIFMVTTTGYGGDIVIMCGIDPDGKIIKTITLSETETKGIATPVFDMESEYAGKDKNLEGIDAISGATITSNAYMGAIRDAFAAFEIVRGMQ